MRMGCGLWESPKEPRLVEGPMEVRGEEKILWAQGRITYCPFDTDHKRAAQNLSVFANRA